MGLDFILSRQSDRFALCAGDLFLGAIFCEHRSEIGGQFGPLPAWCDDRVNKRRGEGFGEGVGFHEERFFQLAIL